MGNTNISYKITKFTTRLSFRAFPVEIFTFFANISQLNGLTTAGFVTHNSVRDDVVSNMNSLD